TRDPAQPRLGPRIPRRLALRPPVHQLLAPETRRRPRQPALHPDRTRSGLPLRGLPSMKINRAIERLSQDKAIYYTGGHTGHVLTYEQGVHDAQTWADYINVGMEHGCFDMTGLAAYLTGLVDGGPAATGHRTPTVIVEAPVNGTDEANIRFNAWQFRQIL